jgi:predicted transcriptional regulator
VEREVLKYLSERGTSMANLSSRLNLPYHRIYYHMVKLMIQGLVRRSKLGQTKKCYISERGRELVATAAATMGFSTLSRPYGKDEFGLENRQVHFLLTPQVGGRILEVRPDRDISGPQYGSNLLHTLYPEKRTFGVYSEFGGIEDQICWGSKSFPGWGWDQKWDARVLSEKNPASLLFEAHGKGTEKMDLRRVYTLDAEEAVMKIGRSFRSRSEGFLTFRWTEHLELCRAIFDSYSVPGKRAIMTGRLADAGQGNHMPCEENWWLVFNSSSGLYVGEVFPDGVLDDVSVYNPKIGDHHAVVPGVQGRLVPGQVASFESYLVIGKGGPESFLGQARRLDPRCQRDAEWECPRDADVSEDTGELG